MSGPARAILACFALLPIAAQAADDAPGSNKIVRGSPIELVATAHSLAQVARSDRNPLGLLVAAEMRQRVGVRQADRRPDQAPGDPQVVEAGADSVEGLLAEAMTLSGKDPTIAALADDILASATKGRVSTIAVSVATATANGTDWYRKQKFEGTRYAEAYVELLGQGGLNIYVYDDAGNLVCRDVSPSASAYCGWTPLRTGAFDIKVENRTDGAVRYRLSTN